MNFFGKNKDKDAGKGKGKAVGIDLGTTNSSIAINIMDTEILQNIEGEDLTPSVVSVCNKKILVGRKALNVKKKYPKQTVVASKRLMGADFHSDEVQKYLMDNRFAYTIVHRPGTASETAICIDNKFYAPEEIAAEILKKIKQDGEIKLEKIERAIVTVPAYFNDKAKYATKKAAEMAGLNVTRLLPEPTAAAISFNLEEKKDGIVLVYDFGGGTFDCSLLNMVDGQFIEMGKSGDMWLGGNDIDSLIVDEILKETEKEYSLSSVNELINNLPTREKYLLQDALVSEAEKAKILLGEKENAVVSILGLLKDQDGDIIDIDVEINRNRFEKLITPTIEKSIKICIELIKSVGLDNSQIDYYLLVGGTVKLPLIQRMMKEAFGDDFVKISKYPMSAVSHGAAILANQLNLDNELIENENRIEVIHSTAHDYYLELAKGEELLLVEKNTPLPHSITYDLKTLDDIQNFVHFRFFNKIENRKEQIGDIWLAYDLLSELNKKLTTFGMGYDDLKKFKDRTKKSLEISFKLEIDENNIFTVTAFFKDFPSVEITKTLSRGKRDEQIFLEIEKRILKEVDNDNSKLRVAWEEYLRNIACAAMKVSSLNNSSNEKDELELEKEIWDVVNHAEDLLNNERILPLLHIDYVSNIIGINLDKIPSLELKKIILRLKKIKDKCEIGKYTKSVEEEVEDVLELFNEKYCHFSTSYTINEILKNKDTKIESSLKSIFETELAKIEKYIVDKKYDQARNKSLQFRENYLGRGHAMESNASFNKDIVLL